MEKIVIDASETVLGRLCSYVAKEAMKGNEVVIINSNKTIITGNKKSIFEKYKQRKARGGKSRKGPNYPRLSYMILKRSIRGMLPNFRKGSGRDALSRIRCYDGVPKQFEGHKSLNIKTQTKQNFVYLKDISENI